MKNKNKEVLKEFLASTPRWLYSMAVMEEHSHFKLCPYCGVNYKKIKRLAEAVDELLKNNEN
jgi:hypothetical protein